MIVKDNFETKDLPTTAGSLSLAGWVSAKDAFQVRKIREAGAIILAKSNMAEFAFSPYETVSSILPGYTRNPYALDRVTAGSSGGTAASVAASFGAVGLGSDTGNSIRGPARTPGPGRNSIYDGVDEPRWCRSAKSCGRYRGTARPHRRRCSGSISGDCGKRSR